MKCVQEFLNDTDVKPNFNTDVDVSAMKQLDQIESLKNLIYIIEILNIKEFINVENALEKGIS